MGIIKLVFSIIKYFEKLYSLIHNTTVATDDVV